MNRTILIIIGILCVVLSAAGIILFYILTNEFRHKEVLSVETRVLKTIPEIEKDFFSITDTVTPPIELTTMNNPLKAFVIPGEIDMGEYADIVDKQKVKNIEKSALDQINKIISPKDRQEGGKAVAHVLFSSDRTLVVYYLMLYKEQKKRGDYSIKFRKDANNWIVISLVNEGEKRFD